MKSHEVEFEYHEVEAEAEFSFNRVVFKLNRVRFQQNQPRDRGSRPRGRFDIQIERGPVKAACGPGPSDVWDISRGMISEFDIAR